MARKTDSLPMIMARRSTLIFGSKPVDFASVKKILEAGRWAPSPLNVQPWHFIVVEGKGKIDALMKTPYYGDAHNAPPLIIAIAIEGKYWKAEFENGAAPGALGLMECHMSAAMAALNMVYAAQSLGIDSCIITPAPTQAEQILGMNERDFIPIFLCFGHGEKMPAGRKRERNKMEYIVSYEEYGNVKRRRK